MRFVALGVLLLAGCASAPACPSLPPAPALVCDAAPPRTVVRLQERDFFRSIRDEHGVAWLAMDGAGYRAMSENMAGIMLILKEQVAVIRYYERCIEEHQEAGHGPAD